jgi:hypothetical protein
MKDGLFVAIALLFITTVLFVRYLRDIGDEVPDADTIIYGDSDAGNSITMNYRTPLDIIYREDDGSIMFDLGGESCHIDQLITIAYAAASGITLTDRQMETVVLCDRITKEIREFYEAEATSTPTATPLVQTGR